jgi:DNA mismatch endonuclease, patch repair protein
MRYDPLTPAERSELMSRIRSKDTKPEWAVRRLVHGLGYRYRLHAKELPGHPDLVFRPRRKVIFVHGCFWHQHACKHFRMPRTRVAYWREKLDKNVSRDRKTQRVLRKAGWKLLVVWECQVKNTERLQRRVVDFLEKK